MHSEILNRNTMNSYRGSIRKNITACKLNRRKRKNAYPNLKMPTEKQGASSSRQKAARIQFFSVFIKEDMIMSRKFGSGKIS